MSTPLANHSEMSSGKRLFDYPSGSTKMLDRSREALLLRLEQLNLSKSESATPQDEAREESPSPQSNSQIWSEEIDIKKPVHSPIYRVGRGMSGNDSSGQNYPRGLTDDMMFYASHNISDSGEDSEQDASEEEFIPPHKQHVDSFSAESYL